MEMASAPSGLSSTQSSLLYTTSTHPDVNLSLLPSSLSYREGERERGRGGERVRGREGEREGERENASHENLYKILVCAAKFTKD